jgi:hypothetical protein
MTGCENALQFGAAGDQPAQHARIARIVDRPLLAPPRRPRSPVDALGNSFRVMRLIVM